MDGWKVDGCDGKVDEQDPFRWLKVIKHDRHNEEMSKNFKDRPKKKIPRW